MSVKHFSSQEFESQVLNGTGLALIDFWADWCGPCKMLAPTIDKLAESFPDLLVAKVNIDEESALAMKFGVMSIPTLILFRDGKELDRSVGLLPESRIASWIESHR